MQQPATQPWYIDYQPHHPLTNGTFGADPYQERSRFEPENREDILRVSLRKIDGHWHVIATEPGHAEHVHQDAFRFFEDARQLRDAIRRGTDNGEQLNLRHWDTRAL